MLIVAPPLRRPKGTLTAPLQVFDNPGANKPVCRSLCFSRIAKRKIFGPSPDLPVDAFYQFRHGHMALVSADQISKLFPLCLQRFPRRSHIQISKSSAFKVPVISECIPQKIQGGPGLSEVYHLRFVPVDLQVQPRLDLQYNIVAQPAPLVSGQDHKVIRIANNFSLSPVARPVGRMKYFLEPMKVHIGQKRGKLPHPVAYPFRFE